MTLPYINFIDGRKLSDMDLQTNPSAANVWNICKTYILHHRITPIPPGCNWGCYFQWWWQHQRKWSQPSCPWKTGITVLTKPLRTKPAARRCGHLCTSAPMKNMTTSIVNMTSKYLKCLGLTFYLPFTVFSWHLLISTHKNYIFLALLNESMLTALTKIEILVIILWLYENNERTWF